MRKKKDDISKLILSRHGPTANCTLKSDTKALFALVQMCLIATGTRLQTPLNHTSMHPVTTYERQHPKFGTFSPTFRSWKYPAQTSLRIHRSIRKSRTPLHHPAERRCINRKHWSLTDSWQRWISMSYGCFRVLHNDWTGSQIWLAAVMLRGAQNV